jgi:heparan-alpha-glucosaminide N-acetyltransferase
MMTGLTAIKGPLTTQSRIAAIDILRALTMLLMIFVNDLWSLTDIPQWLGHTDTNEDGMGFADVIFPAFLFIVGMSIPFAVTNRRNKGDTTVKIVGHILLRALALIIMGLFLVNGEYLNADETGISRRVWNNACCLSFILIWNAYPPTLSLWVRRLLKSIGIITLLVLAFSYRGGSSGEVNYFSTYWWGILGLIGWAYLITALTFTFFGNRIVSMVAAWTFFLLLSMAFHAGWITVPVMLIVIDPFEAGAMPALTMGGLIVSLIYLRAREHQPHWKVFASYAIICLLLLAMGFYTRTFWIVSKNLATPPWVLICSALTLISCMAIFWLGDVKGKVGWFALIRPAGTNTLLCYLLPHFAYAVVGVLSINYPAFMTTGFTGLIKSMTFALIIVFLAGWLEHRGVQLKL